MGMDAVDILFRLEDEFNVDLTGDDIQEASTAGDLFDAVRRQIAEPSTCVCVGAQVFRQIAAAASTWTPLVGDPIWPSTTIARVAPGHQIRTLWHRIADQTGYRLPPLEGSPALRQAAGPILVFGVGIAAMFFSAGIWDIGACGLGLCAFALLLMVIPVGPRPPVGCRTFGGLARVVASRNRRRTAHDYGGINEHETWLAVRRILADVLGLDPREIRRDSHLVRDLGMS